MCKIKPQNLLWLKAILYRIVRMGIVFLSSFFILGDTNIAISIMSVDVIAATIFYYLFDKWWCYIEEWIQSLIIKIKYRKFK
jgi:uncharacterized membrane protein